MSNPGKSVVDSAVSLAPSELPVIPELDGVRGIAILAVLFFHFGHLLPYPGNVVFRLGWMGVDLFFALSGFLITRILWNTKLKDHYFLNFYGRRVLRIFPLAFAFLAAYFWIALPVAHRFGYDLDRNGADQLWYWGYLANWHLGLHGSLTHLWSLSIEEQFYLVWPSVIFLASLAKLKRICLGLIVVPLVSRFVLMNVFHYYTLTQGLTFCRTEALALGALICLCGEIRLLPRIAVLSAAGILVISAVNGTDGKIMGLYGLTLVAFACAGLVNETIKHAGDDTLLSRSLRTPLLRKFGKYSYAIYVLHTPILAATFHAAAKYGTPVRNCVFFVVGIGVAYAAGWVSWRVFERKLLRLKRYFSYERGAASYETALAPDSMSAA